MPGKEKEPEMRETVGEQSREKRDRPGKLDNLTEREGWGKRGSNRKKKSREAGRARRKRETTNGSQLHTHRLLPGLSSLIREELELPLREAWGI